MQNRSFLNKSIMQFLAHKYCRLRLAGLMVFALFVFTGCASVPLQPAQPATDLKAISGKWEGSFFSLTGKLVSSTLTIKEDGTYVDYIPELPTTTWTGKVDIVDGKYRSKSETSGRLYTITLHEENGIRQLVKVPDDSTYSTARYSQAK